MDMSVARELASKQQIVETGSVKHLLLSGVS